MLDAVQELELLGSNEWGLVHHAYSKWAKDNDRPVRDLETSRFLPPLRNSKKTGDSSCPPDVRRAKYIKRSITQCSNSPNVDSDQSDGEATNNITQAESDSGNSSPNHRALYVGERANKLKSGAHGISSRTEKPKPGDEMLHCMKVIAENERAMYNAIANEATNAIEDTVLEHVMCALTPALSDILEMKQPTKTLLE